MNSQNDRGNICLDKNNLSQSRNRRESIDFKSLSAIASISILILIGVVVKSDSYRTRSNYTNTPNLAEQKSDKPAIAARIDTKYLAEDRHDYSELLDKIEGLENLELLYAIDEIKVDKNAQITYSTGEKTKAIAILSFDGYSGYSCTCDPNNTRDIQCYGCTNYPDRGFDPGWIPETRFYD